jgi:hypothetical protein
MTGLAASDMAAKGTAAAMAPSATRAITMNEVKKR